MVRGLHCVQQELRSSCWTIASQVLLGLCTCHVPRPLFLGSFRDIPCFRASLQSLLGTLFLLPVCESLRGIQSHPCTLEIPTFKNHLCCKLILVSMPLCLIDGSSYSCRHLLSNLPLCTDRLAACGLEALSWMWRLLQHGHQPSMVKSFIHLPTTPPSWWSFTTKFDPTVSSLRMLGKLRVLILWSSLWFKGYKDMDPKLIPQFEEGKREAVARQLLEAEGKLWFGMINTPDIWQVQSGVHDYQFKTVLASWLVGWGWNRWPKSLHFHCPPHLAQSI